MKNLLRLCPICGNLQGEILHNQRFSLSLDSPLPCEYDIVSCSRCGFVFADTISGQEKYNEYYESFSKYEDKNSTAASGGGIENWDRERLSKTSKQIADFIKDKNKKILDIGCANGGLLQMLKDQGFRNLYGLDPSQLCVKNVIQYGLACERGSLFEINKIYANKKFDMIILSHVLEHIYDLELAITLITELLEIHGEIYVEVPDASRYVEFYLVPFHYFDVEHINHFNIHFINSAFSSVGFTVVDYLEKEIPVSSTVNYPAISVFLKKESTEKNLEQIVYNDSLALNIKSYIELSKNNDSYPEIAELARLKTPIVIWGAGSFTSRLLDNSILKKCNIKALIDKDIKKQGNEINGIKIFSPEILQNFNDPIVICSALYSNVILKEIEMMGIQNKVHIMS